MVKLKLVPASDTPLNGKVGPHRIVDWLSTSLGDVKAIRKALGCSVNDVVLGTVTGAVREFLIDRQVRPEGIEFRVATPVNVRPRSAEGKGGNYVSTWIVTLPVDEADPLKRVARIHEATQEFKDSHVESVIDLVEAIHEWIPIDLQAIAEGTQNLYVTNVPGPPIPLYLLGAELLEIYIQPPLIENLGTSTVFPISAASPSTSRAATGSSPRPPASISGVECIGWQARGGARAQPIGSTRRLERSAASAGNPPAVRRLACFRKCRRRSQGQLSEVVCRNLGESGCQRPSYLGHAESSGNPAAQPGSFDSSWRGSTWWEIPP
ncbi:MAG: DUF1298 domain-containing protein [Deltaproteobacteria bacterium]|nr:DUF1298 domain-containing protein [Deltaproteobacteria bacterium]